VAGEVDGETGAGGESIGDSDGEVDESVGVGEGGDEAASGEDAVGEVADFGGVAVEDDFGDDADPEPEGAGEDFGEAVGEVDGALEEKAVVASKEIRKKTVAMLEDIVDDFDLN
jgi:hypothetical protein